MTQYARYPSGSVSVASVGQGSPNTVANAWPVLVTDGTRTAAVTAASAVKVDGSAVTQPVSGTVTANAGTGTFNTADACNGPVTAGAVASKSALVGGQFNTSLPTLTTGQQAAVQVDSSGRLLVGSVAGSVAVTGTFWQATQPVSGTFWQATQPVSAASLPLPTGAATSTKQPAFGTPGTAVADVVTVQGIASMTALKVDGSAVTQPVSIAATVTTDQTAAAATWQAEGSIAFGSLSTTFATAFTTGGVMRWVGLRNNTNGTVVVSLDGGTTSAFTLDAGDQVSLDLKSAGRQIAASTAIQAKYTGTAPTTGTFRVNGYS